MLSTPPTLTASLRLKLQLIHMSKAHFCHPLCRNNLRDGLTIVLWQVLAMLEAVSKTLLSLEVFKIGSDSVDE